MTDTSPTIDPPRPTGSGRITEALMLATFAVICSTVGGLLHLAANLPASTAALIALASMSIVVAANAMIRRKATISVLNAQIAELRMEINGLRSARAAAPLTRPQMPTVSPKSPQTMTAPGEARPRPHQPADASRGAHPPKPSPPHPRPPAPDAMGPAQPTGSPAPRRAAEQTAAGTAPSPAIPVPLAPSTTQAKRQAGSPPPAQAGGSGDTRQGPSPGPLPSPKPGAPMDWTLRPGAHREPTIRIPPDVSASTAPGASGPLPLMPSQTFPGLTSTSSSSRQTPAAERHAAASSPSAPEDGKADHHASKPASDAPSLKSTPQASAHTSTASPIDDLAMPPPDGAPRAMSRPETGAWPRVVPKSPTAPLDLDTMQNLIEQLAGQLDQDTAPSNADAQPALGTPARTAEASVTVPAAPRDRVMPAPVLPRPAPVRTARSTSATERDSTPFGHLALIAEAVEAQRMDVLLDPILGLSDRRARHFELSVRLRTETGNSLEEAHYAPVAAGTGLLGRIDAEKLTRAADVLQRLRARGSAASLFSTVAGESLSDDTFASAFAGVLSAEEGNASRLVLTFQQAEARNFTDAHWRAISDMSRIGLKFALTGVTDLDMDFEVLKRHGFDFIKLDAQVFLDGLPTPSGIIPAADICRHLAGMGLGLIVGGIVEEKDLARILGFGVLLGQGALFGGPRSVEIERERRAA